MPAAAAPPPSDPLLPTPPAGDDWSTMSVVLSTMVPALLETCDENCELSACSAEKQVGR